MHWSRRSMIAAVVCGTLMAQGCSPTAREETREAADAVASETKAGAEEAAETAKAAGRDISKGAQDAAEKTREIAGEVADASKRAAITAGEAMSDGWITTKVKAKILDETVLKGSDINVDTANHVVTLKGSVPSSAARERAETIAKGTEGVTRVLNQLVVK
jgi:hyperosmotically inducible protein